MSSFRISKILVFVVLLISAHNSYGQKLTPEEIVAKHLDSIGSKEKRAELKNLLVSGSVTFSILRSASVVQGVGVFLSENNKLYFGTKFNSVDYPFEEIVSDGNKSNIAFIRPGIRSALGTFLTSQSSIIDEGLFGGTLTTAWSLFDLQAHKAKLVSNGKKKINGRDTYVFDYHLNRTSNLSISLYFDAETFQHVRTEYRQRVPPPLSRKPTESLSQIETNYKLTEDFSEFKTVNGLNLPHVYQVSLLIDSESTKELIWKFNFSDFKFNQKIDDKSFVIN